MLYGNDLDMKVNVHYILMNYHDPLIIQISVNLVDKNGTPVKCLINDSFSSSNRKIHSEGIWCVWPDTIEWNSVKEYVVKTDEEYCSRNPIGVLSMEVSIEDVYIDGDTELLQDNRSNDRVVINNKILQNLGGGKQVDYIPVHHSMFVFYCVFAIVIIIAIVIILSACQAYQWKNLGFKAFSRLSCVIIMLILVSLASYILYHQARNDADPPQVVVNYETVYYFLILDDS